jgi:glycosyltransferase involved in cell wall biosynthesis
MSEHNNLQDKDILLSVIIPIYNEEINILPVIENTCICINASNLKSNYELILVNDGSTDNSEEVINNIIKNNYSIRVKHHDVNQGFSAALITGFAEAKGRYVTFIPSDGEIKMQEALRLYNEIGDADILVSSRHCSDQATQKSVRPWYRDILSWGNRILMRLILGFNPKGMEGIFVIRRDILKNISFKSTSSLVCLEVIMNCRKNNCSFAKGIMHVTPRLSGKSKVINKRVFFKSFLDIIKLRKTLNEI